jgi:hypothetical protein
VSAEQIQKLSILLFKATETANNGDVSGNHAGKDHVSDVWNVKLRSPYASVKSIAAPVLDLYPNPARAELHSHSASEVIILDALGRAYTVPNHDGTLDISSLPAGVYYVRGDGKQHARFIKE